MSMCWTRLTKLGFHGFIIFVQIMEVHSASKIFLQTDDEHLKTAAANIVNQCFASSERWSELLILSDRSSHGILEKIHHQSKISNSIVLLDTERSKNGLILPGKCNDYFDTSFEWRGTKTTAVMITTHSVKHLEYVLCFLKNNIPRLWRPRSYFLIVVDLGCDVAEYNDMFKVIWDYWILNAVILSSSNKPGKRNGSGIELYTFNPYSADHPRQWETIIHETVEVSISVGKFNHSWYIFKQSFTEIRSLDDCGDIFFDKTYNLDGYLIPVSGGYPFFYSGGGAMERSIVSDRPMLFALSKSLRFDFIEVRNNYTDQYGTTHPINGSYIGVRGDIFRGRAHFSPISLPALNYPGLEMTYPHDESGICLASQIVGDRSPLSNFADAQDILIGLGVGLLFSTVVFYLQNKSRGILSALLDAERLIIGSSVIHTSVAIKHRTLLGSMLLVVLVVDGAIRGRFISILSVVQPYPNIDTVEQLKEHDLDVIYGAETDRSLLKDPKQLARFQVNLTLEPYIGVVERGNHRQVCFTDCLFLLYWTANQAILHKALTPVRTFKVGFVTAQGWPLKNRYSFEMQKLVEAGLVRKWRSDYAREAEVDGWKQSRTLVPPYAKSTKLDDLLPAFLLLLVGLSIAMIVFVCEMKGWKCVRCLQV